ncbi:hypothetical protein [Terriglobus sp. TAA 43]|uniref:hypothetical protein n=1 Tax=Terriglobus sp. TAA 43 TaxID=278961 RepID=UPI00064885CA|nr:hypothetical protein [Terriglobus sp. TAA 43]
MATVSILTEAHLRSMNATEGNTRTTLLFLAALSLVAAALLGYHPYAEDGGIYASALALQLNPSLFPAFRAFAVAHTGKSLFIPVVAEMVQQSHMPQEVLVTGLFLLSIAATVAAAHGIACVLFRERRQQVCSTLLFALAMGMPVGGTSLYLADPYLTSRSFSTPLILLGLTAILRKRYGAAAVCAVVSFAVHPLMTLWALLPAVFLLIWQRSAKRTRDFVLLALAVVSFMAAIQMVAPVDSAAVRAASLSRGYWFPSQWQWYEWIGLIAPMLMLLVIATGKSKMMSSTAQALAAAMAASLMTVTAGALLLIHTGDTAFLLARLQPLRLLHPVSIVFVLMLGGWLAAPAAGMLRRYGMYLFALGAIGGMLFMQREIYPHSAHWENPRGTSGNGYKEAALWLRQNTSADALIAVDAHYTTMRGEDAQMVRAIAQRSTIPDAAKDGGIASVVPELADTWWVGSQAQEGLAGVSDLQRIQRLRSFGASWILLPADAETTFLCPYRNTDAKVCRLP